MNAGTETKGCGKLVKIAHNTILRVETFLAAITSPTANPSGTLCAARDKEMKAPSFMPLFPPKETPIPMPSERECRVITMIINTIR